MATYRKCRSIQRGFSESGTALAASKRWPLRMGRSMLLRSMNRTFRQVLYSSTWRRCRNYAKDLSRSARRGVLYKVLPLSQVLWQTKQMSTPLYMLTALSVIDTTSTSLNSKWARWPSSVTPWCSVSTTRPMAQSMTSSINLRSSFSQSSIESMILPFQRTRSPWWLAVVLLGSLWAQSGIW